MKIECPRCGVLEESRWIWSGLCADCFLSPETWIEPTTCEPGTTLRTDCVLCGADIDVGELCPACDGVVIRDYMRVFHS